MPETKNVESFRKSSLNSLRMNMVWHGLIFIIISHLYQTSLELDPTIRSKYFEVRIAWNITILTTIVYICTYITLRKKEFSLLPLTSCVVCVNIIQSMHLIYSIISILSTELYSNPSLYLLDNDIMLWAMVTLFSLLFQLDLIGKLTGLWVQTRLKKPLLPEISC